MNIKRLGLVVVIIFVHFMWHPTIAEQPTIHNTRISLGYDGSQTDGDSYHPTISNNGRFVAFSSDASNLVPNDTNGVTDIFIFDLETSITERISVDSNGLEGNKASGFSDLIAVSNDGRYVVFSSEASNLVANDTNTFCEDSRTQEFINCPDVFVKDRSTNEVRLVSVSSEGVQGNGSSGLPSISADGRYVAFMSEANNLVENDTNEVADIFIHDLQTGETKRVSIASDGTQANGLSFINRISANGQYVVFETTADNLSSEDTDDQLDIYTHNLQTGETVQVSGGLPEVDNNRYALIPDISAAGQYVSFYSSAYGPGTLGQITHIYRYNQQAGITEMVSVSASGQEANRVSAWASISGDGRWVVFTSSADNLVDTKGGLCNVGDNMYDFCEHIYLKDMDTGAISLLTKNIVGQHSKSGRAFLTFTSHDGRYVVFDSSSDDLVFGDTNNYRDIFNPSCYL